MRRLSWSERRGVAASSGAESRRGARRPAGCAVLGAAQWIAVAGDALLPAFAGSEAVADYCVFEIARCAGAKGTLVWDRGSITREAHDERTRARPRVDRPAARNAALGPGG